MNTTEYLLTKLVEECCEVAQRVTKAQTFGLHESQPGQPLTNAQRLNYELNDLAAVLGMLRDYEIFTYTRNPVAQNEKKLKVTAYMIYSRELGTLEGPIQGETVPSIVAMAQKLGGVK